MALTFQARLDAVAPVMNSICDRFTNDPDAALNALVREGKDCLKANGLGDYMIVHPSRTVTHPWNRGGDLLEPADVPVKIADISDVGWDMKQVSDASAVKMPMDAKLVSEIEDVNAALVKSSGGVLAPVVPGAATIMTTACGHTSAGLKCTHAETTCAIERISEKGVMCKAKIISRQPTMKDPIEVGMRYFVIEYGVQERWPAFIVLVIEAANCSNSLAKPDSPVQLMLKIHKYGMEYEKKLWTGTTIRYCAESCAQSHRAQKTFLGTSHSCGNGLEGMIRTFCGASKISRKAWRSCTRSLARRLSCWPTPSLVKDAVGGTDARFCSALQRMQMSRTRTLSP